MWSSTKGSEMENFGCNCIGPQNGQPLCPCMMRGIEIREGSYIKPEQDLGPVRETNDRDDLFRDSILNNKNG